MKAQTVSQLGEGGLIDIVERMAPLNARVLKGIGDDAAVLKTQNSHCSLLAADMLVEGVHFKKTDKPSSIGHKSIACNISDIAAMGGVPQYVLVSLGLPATCRVDFVKKVYAGMKKTAGHFDVCLIGGDTVKSKKIVINVAVYGEAKCKDIVYRKGAKKGDIILTTGPLGKSLKTGRHLTFTPRLEESQYLVKYLKPSAMIDISDGLVCDLSHLAKASGLGAVVYEECIPKTKRATIDEALFDGEDFELLFTLSWPKTLKLFKSRHPFRFFPIGEMVAKKNGLAMIDKNGLKVFLKHKGFRHF